MWLSPSMSGHKTQKVDAARSAASTFWVFFVLIQVTIAIKGMTPFFKDRKLNKTEI